MDHGQIASLLFYDKFPVSTNFHFADRGVEKIIILFIIPLITGIQVKLIPKVTIPVL